MRLTLRTLLAYLDNAVEPSEAEALGKKIEESEFASALVKRLRGVILKPRLPAPKVDGKGLGMDANSVAEYIESTLPVERVNDFERLCIESDMHLAEVAATHQILSLVLGRPSKVSQELRERVYAIQTMKPASEGGPAEDRKRWTPEHAEEPVVASLKGPLAAPDEHDEESQKEVPEYLKAAKAAERSWWVIPLTVAAGFLMTAFVLRAMGPFDRTHPLARMFGSGSDEIVSVPPLPESPPQLPPVIPPVQPKTPPVGPAPVDPPPQPELPVDVKPEIPMPVEPMPVVPPPIDPPPVEPMPAVDPKPDEVATLPPVEPLPNVPIEPTPAPDPMPVVPVEPARPVDVGRFISDEQVLARYNSKVGLWERVPSKDVLTSGVPLVALPVYNPLIALPSGVQVTVLGETHFQMMAPGPFAAPRLKLEMGRISVITDGVPGGKLGLLLAEKEMLVTLNDADSLVAVNVRLYLPPGSDPQLDPATPVIEIFAVNGHVDLETFGGEKVELRPQQLMTIVGDQDPQVTGPFLAPAWVDVRGERDIDRDASRVLEKELQGERTLQVELTEGLQDRRVEVRCLAARSLAHLGIFDGILEELTNANQANYWSSDLDTLKSLLVSDPATAARIQQAVDLRFGQHSAAVYRMLWGYSPEQLASGGGADLVKSLEVAALELRVIAAYTLERITGASFAYRASGRPETNRISIARFKEQLQNGELNYKVLPGPRLEYKPLVK